MDINKESINLTKAVLVYVPACNPMHYKPLLMSLIDSNIDEFKETINNQGQINVDVLAELIEQILSPDYDRGAIADIPGGWNISRYSFMFEFSIESSLLGKRVEIVRGFTDTANIILETGEINPNLTFYINSITYVSSAGKPTDPTKVRLHFDENLVLPTCNSQPKAVGLRPVDVLSFLQTKELTQNLDPNVVCYDKRYHLAKANGIKTYSVDNLLPICYLNRLYSAIKEADDHMGHTVEEDKLLYDSAMSRVHDKYYQSSTFFTHILTSKLTVDNTFTFEMLNTHWPRRASFWDNSIRSYATVAEPVEDWQNVDVETNTAYHIPFILYSIMCTLGIGQLDMKVSNTDTTRDPVVNIFSITEMYENSITDTDIETLRLLIERHLIKGLLEPTCKVYTINISIDLVTECRITYNPVHAKPMTYVAPMYCIGYYSPLISPDISYLSDIAEQLEKLMTNVIG